jgi:hypothetical protein
MSKQWKAMTRGGHDYRITARNPDSDFPIRGEVDDSGIVVHVQWKEDGDCVQWTEDGRVYLDAEHPYDLVPVEPEAPSPAKVRVDLALAAHSLRAAVLEFQRAEDQKDKLGKAMFEAFAAASMLDVVVKIEGDHYHFFASEGTTRFRKIEVL